MYFVVSHDHDYTVSVSSSFFSWLLIGVYMMKNLCKVALYMCIWNICLCSCEMWKCGIVERGSGSEKDGWVICLIGIKDGLAIG